VLVVEDDADLRYLFRISLAIAGFSVRVAADGYQALAAIEEDTPAAVVLDLGLPRVSGFTVLEEIAARRDICGVPVIVVTGLDVTDGNDGAGVTILRKPVEPPELVSAVRDAIRRADGSAHVR
jgi:DNA-binding response OmpR family regulator